MPITRGGVNALSRPMGYRKDVFVFELRCWHGPRPNHATGQFHAFVLDRGVVTRLVGCPGLSGAVCLFPNEQEIHVALGTRIMRFEKQAGVWVRVQDIPDKIGVTEFKVFSTYGAMCWSVNTCWKWNEKEWAPYPFPVTRFGSIFSFSDIQEYQGRLYAVGYAGIMLVLEETGWKEVQTPTTQAIQVVAVGDGALFMAARTTTESAPGGIWKYAEGMWTQVLVHTPPAAFLSMCLFLGKIYVTIDGMGVYVVEQGGLIPCLINKETKPGLFVSAQARALFICTKDEIFISEDGIRFESFHKTEGLAQMPA